MRSPPVNVTSPLTTVPAPIRLSIRFCGVSASYVPTWVLLTEITRLRVARGLAWPDSKARAVSDRERDPFGTPKVPSSR